MVAWTPSAHSPIRFENCPTPKLLPRQGVEPHEFVLVAGDGGQWPNERCVERETLYFVGRVRRQQLTSRRAGSAFGSGLIQLLENGLHQQRPDDGGVGIDFGKRPPSTGARISPNSRLPNRCSRKVLPSGPVRGRCGRRSETGARRTTCRRAELVMSMKRPDLLCPVAGHAAADREDAQLIGRPDQSSVLEQIEKRIERRCPRHHLGMRRAATGRRHWPRDCRIAQVATSSPTSLSVKAGIKTGTFCSIGAAKNPRALIDLLTSLRPVRGTAVPTTRRRREASTSLRTDRTTTSTSLRLDSISSVS